MQESDRCVQRTYLVDAAFIGWECPARFEVDGDKANPGAQREGRSSIDVLPWQAAKDRSPRAGRTAGTLPVPPGRPCLCASLCLYLMS